MSTANNTPAKIFFRGNGYVANNSDSDIITGWRSAFSVTLLRLFLSGEENEKLPITGNYLSKSFSHADCKHIDTERS